MSSLSSAAPHPELSPWISPHHLEAGAIARSRERFESSPHSLLILDGFLHEQIATRVAAFLATEAVFNRYHLLYPGEVVSEQDWDTAEPSRRFSRDEAATGVQAGSEMSPNVLAFLALRTALGSASLVELLQQLSGLALEGAAGSDVCKVKRMRPGDFIAPHDDVVNGRVLSLNIHFSRDWQPALGGQLYLETGDGDQTDVETGWNRAVIMRALPRMTHGVRPVAEGAGDRLMIGSWYR